ncbi:MULTISPECIES: NAD(P)/FAD-dependent oxidoreductase [unclassified Moorena]|uniref:flavin monoamine oxidase family protein n=1 Tax=unclassified Moorena TaxID=2683338 RepID=UPI0013FEC225|nr:MULTISPECIES: NAD(P)/FAD-dependent oxidoreductase [unclassified Moorena]NEO16015.1 FAD-dependent oxidoreductase [Moorena sp. SIO3E8]NEQ03052.1 FAD-dependent oxidoreductase [Moorena sp. SIO3F7]
MFNPYRHTQELERPFSFERLYRHPGSLSPYDQGGTRKRIGIIGGGIAGLVSAYELSQLNHQVTVLEADSRLGGRIKTHYFSDGTYGELGAMRIPTSHGCTLHYIDKFNLPKRPFINYNPAAFYYLRGKKTRLDSYQELFGVYKLTSDEQQDPGEIYDQLLEELIDSLTEKEKWELFAPTFTSDQVRKWDTLTFTDYFRSHLSPDAFELLGHATGAIHYDKVSLLNGLIDFFAWHRVEQYELIGGLETLIKALVKRISGIIQTEARVTTIEMTDRGVRLVWNKLDKQQTAEFDYIICTIPATALAQINFDPSLPSQQREAINNLGYCSASKTLLHCTARPWEFADHVYGGGSFTDLNFEKCWYPSDNAQLDSKNLSQPHFVAKDQDISYQPSVLTAAYRWEDNSRKFRTLEETAKTDLTLDEVSQLHPDIKDYTDDIIHSIWDEDNQSGSGSYAYFAPGDRENYQPLLGQAYPVDNPRVFFAGEHLAINHASVQGAVQTAETAVIDLLESSIFEI